MDRRDAIIQVFPKLLNDDSYKITSPCDSNYNCIAWAYGMHKDRWMQPLPHPYLDAVWWPEGIKKEMRIETYIEAFSNKGFEICDKYDLEPRYVKVALFVKETGGLLVCSHAARQKTTGIWTSKLGEQFDIEHGTPFFLEGNVYGKVYCCMKLDRYKR